MNFRELNSGSMSSTLTAIIAAILGFLLGTNFPACSLSKFQIRSQFFSYGRDANSSMYFPIYNSCTSCENNTFTFSSSTTNFSDDKYKIFVPSNPKGVETLAPGIVVSESDLYLHRLWGDPNEDLPIKSKYLVAFAVSLKQKDNVNAAVQKFSENFTILLFHYDGHMNEWDEFEWSTRAIHVGTRGQTKWWYAKRFLHPDIVASYEYIFIWDEDLGVEHFDAEQYIKLVKKYGLEISQPAIESSKDFAYQITKRRTDTEFHKKAEDRKCPDPNETPCTEFIEIMAPVFSKDAWRCVWHIIQNDLIHGWGLDFTLKKCVEPASEKMGIVDAQWIFHHAVTTLRDQGEEDPGKRTATAKGIADRCYLELGTFKERWHQAERSYYKMKGLIPLNSTATFTHFP
ncbi:lysine ketoglutarate reductase trans-splicing protein (DUF707) [Rhynchospora pubera]|uniref:Lysine ketoglutarate reductase trans-splicing protein (DUF707) n=1 Tax=Rhynchospora pubera TaxID=906938 RepID=A0AAV8FYL0_9POAL|nr:lysine ketoglutarate reductase trans-splicing protein (DUF707) [Rhynchospora pubera]